MKKQGFTLVELLVVVGIITVLISLLVPVMSRVRQSVAQAACANNMRQIGFGLINYAADNGGHFPFCAAQGPGHFTPGEWIDWRKIPGQNLQRSAIAKYMGRVTEQNFRCPSDVLEAHTRVLDGGNPYYYSYTLNFYLASDGITQPPITYSRITHPATLLMLVDEDESSADDGNYYPNLPSFPNRLAVRHDTNRRSSGDGSLYNDPDLYRRGNVLMADGHVQFVDRAWTNVPAHFDPLVP